VTSNTPHGKSDFKRIFPGCMMKSLNPAPEMSRHNNAAGRRLLDASRWFLFLILFASVWLWGGTRSWTREVIAWALLADTLFFAMGLLFLRRLPRVSHFAGCAIAGLLCIGTFLTWNAGTRFVTESATFEVITAPIPSLPGFMDQTMVIPELLLTLGLLGAFCIASDLASNQLWRSRCWHVIAVTGVSLVALGIAQRLSNAPAIFWNIYENTGHTFFGTYRYHANAGAYLNLILPMTAGLAVLALRQESQFPKAFWIPCSLVTLAACFVNVSRGAMVVTILIILVGTPWILLSQGDGRHNHGKKPRGQRWMGAGAIVLGVIMVAASIGVDRSMSRWSGPRSYTDMFRYQTYDALIHHVLPVSGWWGSGPGTFERLFAVEIKANQLPIKGRWDKAHSDHLQMILEWGVWGYICWMVLLLGGIVKGVIQATSGKSQPARVLGICISLALLGVLLHALIDFPLQIVSLLLLSLCLAGLVWGYGLKERDSGR
jgi:hypothetical protein